MAIALNASQCCCASISPAWTVYHSNVSEKQHLLHLMTSALGLSGSNCALATNLTSLAYGDSSIPCVYSGEVSGSWIYKGCPFITNTSTGVFSWTNILITTTPLSQSLTGIYTGNTWIKPLKIEKIELYWNSIINGTSGVYTYTYDDSKPWYASSHHYCGHSEFSGALSYPVAGLSVGVSVTPYIGYRYADSGYSAYLYAPDIQGSSVCSGYGYFSGWYCPVINNTDSINRHYSGIFGDWFARISGTVINNSGTASLYSCSGWHTYTDSTSYDIRFNSKLLPLHLNPTGTYNYSCSGRCSGENLIIQSTVQNRGVPVAAPEYTNFAYYNTIPTHASCFVYYFTNLYFGPCSTLVDDTYTLSFCSGSTTLSGTYITMADYFNYMIPSLPTGAITDACNLMSSSTFGLFPSGGLKEPMIIENPILAAISIGNKVLSTDTIYTPLISGCFDGECYGNTVRNISGIYKSKIYLADNSIPRHICDDFNIADFNSQYTGSGERNVTCVSTEVYDCAFEGASDGINNLIYNYHYLAMEDDTNLSFLHFTTTQTDGCAV